jgi:spermidine synthase
VLRIIVRTFLDVFPEAQAWMLQFAVDTPVVGLVGRDGPVRLSPDAVESNAHVRGLASELRKVALASTLNLAGCFLAGPEALRRYAGDGERNTFDRPIVSFLAARLTGAGSLDPPGLFLDLVERFRDDPEELLDGPPSEARETLARDLRAFRAARDTYLEGLVMEARDDLPRAVDLYIEAARKSVHFMPAYARSVTIIQVLAEVNRESARALFRRLEEAQPAQPLGRRVLGAILEVGDQGGD